MDELNKELYKLIRIFKIHKILLQILVDVDCKKLDQFVAHPNQGLIGAIIAPNSIWNYNTEQFTYKICCTNEHIIKGWPYSAKEFRQLFIEIWESVIWKTNSQENLKFDYSCKVHYDP